MPTNKQLPEMEIRYCTMTVRQYSRENPTLYGRRSSFLLCPACIMSSLAPCLHEDADTRMFACATEGAKRPYKKKSSCAVDSDVKGVKKIRSAI